jgi:UDP-glucose:glycoprotein glucosyltransferase
MTKEPKLVRARQIPEWDTYDREIAAFAARLEKTEKTSQAGAMARGVDDLAADPAIKVDESRMGGDDEEGTYRKVDEL